MDSCKHCGAPISQTNHGDFCEYCGSSLIPLDELRRKEKSDDRPIPMPQLCYPSELPYSNLTNCPCQSK